MNRNAKKTLAAAATPTGPRPANRLLAALRRWHRWLGVGAALFLLVFGLTGILLNYKKPIFTALGLESQPASAKPDSSGEADIISDRPAVPTDNRAPNRFTTVTGFDAAIVSPAAALEIGRRELGEVALERIELKQERDSLVWKIKSRAGREVLIHAATGRAFVKGAYEKLGPPDADGRPAQSFDWGKFFLDLHTGKIGGEVGKAIMTVAAAGLLFLTVSGLYLWIKPLFIRRANARAGRKVAPVPLPNQRAVASPMPVQKNGHAVKPPSLLAQPVMFIANSASKSGPVHNCLGVAGDGRATD